MVTKRLRIFIPAVAVLLLFAGVSLLAGLQLGGAAAARELLDPGVFVRFAAPVSRGLVNISISVMLGSLLFAMFALNPKKREWRVLLDLAAASAAVLTVVCLVSIIVTYSDVSGLPLSAAPQFGAGLWQFVTQFELGQLWLMLLVLAAVTAVCCFAVRGRKMLILPLATAVLTTFPLAAQGHAAGASGHSLA
ncbi:MAG: copper transporter, partial [Microbacteriaceae bacterium]|nr:copper transporter [Microbacteriaceae bacterium]